MKNDHRGFNPASKPSGDGCVECLASRTGWWFHLRWCAECGHIGVLGLLAKNVNKPACFVKQILYATSPRVARSRVIASRIHVRDAFR